MTAALFCVYIQAVKCLLLDQSHQPVVGCQTTLLCLDLLLISSAVCNPGAGTIIPTSHFTYKQLVEVTH